MKNKILNFLFSMDVLGELGYRYEKCYFLKKMHHVFKRIKQSHSGWSVVTFIFPLCVWAIKEERKEKKLCKMHLFF